MKELIEYIIAQVVSNIDYDTNEVEDMINTTIKGFKTSEDTLSVIFANGKNLDIKFKEV